VHPRVRQSGGRSALHGPITKAGPAHARGLLVEAAWAASTAPGPLRVFYQRICARRGKQVAVVATARKLVVLCWHLSVKGEDYAFARPSLLAHKQRKLELRAGQPAARGRPGPAAGYHHKAVRDAERRLAEQAEHAYRTFTAAWQPTPPADRRKTSAPTPVAGGVDVAAATGARLPKPTKGQAARQGQGPRSLLFATGSTTPTSRHATPVLTGVKAVPTRWPPASLDPGSGPA
jgi:hypothetical protein